jgi:hypothetical protein
MRAAVLIFLPFVQSFTTPPHPFFNSPCYPSRMEPSWTHQPEICLTQPFGPGARLVMALAGFAVCVTVLRDLSGALVPFSFLSLVFGAVLVGLCSVGLAIVLLSSFGESLSVTLRQRDLLVERINPWWVSRRRYGGKDIAAVTIRTSKWSDGPDTFTLAVALKSGRSFETPSLTSMLKAQELETELRARLGLPPLSH